MSLDIHLEKVMPTDVYWTNWTHNLGKMAAAVDLYKPLWRPEECGIETAADLIPILERGIAELKSDPAKYSALDSPNGWGRYVHFVPLLDSLLAACREDPDATIRVSR